MSSAEAGADSAYVIPFWLPAVLMYAGHSFPEADMNLNSSPASIMPSNVKIPPAVLVICVAFAASHPPSVASPVMYRTAGAGLYDVAVKLNSEYCSISG